jgi:hypothetical protein
MGGLGIFGNPPNTPYFFPQHTTYLPANSEGFLIGAIRTTPTCYHSYQLLAQEWQSVEYFAPGYYPTHALANMLTRRP